MSQGRNNQEAYQKISPEETAKKLQTDLKTGLTSSEAASRLRKYGANRNRKESGPNPLSFLFAYQSLFALAGALYCFYRYFILDEPYRVILQLGVFLALQVLVKPIAYKNLRNTRAESFNLLKNKGYKVEVKRDGKWKLVQAETLVPGDIVKIQAGLIIPADLRVSQADRVEVRATEIAPELESYAISVKEEDTNVADARNLILDGSAVTSGAGEGVVYATGRNTMISRIADLAIANQTNQSFTFCVFGLPVRVSSFLFPIVITTTAVIATFFLKYYPGSSFYETITFNLSVVVALSSSVIDVATTIGIAQTFKKLLKTQVIVRNTAVIQSLPQVDCLITNPISTMTGQRKLSKLWTGGDTFDVAEVMQKKGKSLMELWNAAIATCEGLRVGKSVYGSSLDVCLLQFFEKYIRNHEELKKNFIDVQQFRSNDKATWIFELDRSDSEYTVIVKGKFDVVWKMCSTILVDDKAVKKDASIEQSFNLGVNSLLKDGGNLIGYAKLHLPKSKFPKDYEFKNEEDAFTKDLTFLGCLSIKETIRENISVGIQNALKSGIKLVLVSGDTKARVQSISNEVGLTKTANAANSLIVSGDEVMNIFSAQVKEADLDSKQIIVYECNPSQRKEIVNKLQQLGYTVCVTGDGSADIAALQNAEIGVALASGSDEAKQNSDILLLNDNINSLLQSQREAEASIRLYENISYTFYGTKATQLFVMVFMYLGFPFPASTNLISLMDYNDLLFALYVYFIASPTAKSKTPKSAGIVNGILNYFFILSGLILAIAAFSYTLHQCGIYWDEAFFITAKVGVVPKPTDKLDTTVVYGGNSYIKDAVMGSQRSPQYTTLNWNFEPMKYPNLDIRLFYLRTEGHKIFKTVKYTPCTYSIKEVCYRPELILHASTIFVLTFLLSVGFRFLTIAQRYQTESRVKTYSWLALLFVVVQVPIVYAVTKVNFFKRIFVTRDVDLTIPLAFGLGGGLALFIISNVLLLIFSRTLPSYRAQQAEGKLKRE